MKKIQLDSAHFLLIENILNQNQVVAFVFGSRAKGSAKTLSDLDLCLKQDYGKSKIRKLKDDFEESDLPFKVDIVLWSELSESFQRHIESDLVKFEIG